MSAILQPNEEHIATSSLRTEMQIAIIGMSCKFPGTATDPEALWRLCEEGRSAWSEIPPERFNKDAFYHPCAERPTTTNVTGGHFLKEDIGLFDANFFNMTPEVSATMDPQCRLQLESVYEALESSGTSIEDIAGSRTAVYSGAFYKDYMDSLMRDPEELPRYVMTGNGATMMANRISHFYDLRGPSMTVDTGCSTGLVALHQACQSLKTHDAKVAIVVGANIMINPDVFILWSSLGFLSPDGKCYSFDSRASGYGRGEGVAALVLKPLHEAIRDGDPIRAVIAQTALNQDGKTPTITSPSQSAQEELMRLCYTQANLDPGETAYVEAHGTGTKAGDPTEAAAIHSVFCKDRDRDQPLFLGSVKSNIGHLETASGFAAILKVALALDKGLIPPSINFENGNENIPFEDWDLKIPTRLEPWPKTYAKRASINNFGYGGANAHVIMEAWEPHLISVRDTTREGSGLESCLQSSGASTTSSISNAKEDCFDKEEVALLDTPDSASSVASASSSLPSQVLLLSAKDEAVASEMVSRLKAYVINSALPEDELVSRLAHTLGDRRSLFPWRVAFSSATTRTGLISRLRDLQSLKPIRSTKAPRLGYVFTGQGAQWYAMARELIDVYPIFTQTLQEADKHLREMNSTWGLLDELTKNEAESQVNDVVLSPPLCIAVQIGLVRLLESWNVRPTAITSHSSGEIAAAYAAGLIDLREAMAIVFARGAFLRSLQENAHYRGAMIVAGIGCEDAESFMQRMGTTGRTVVACVNSPSSVTISGDQAAIAILEEQLNQDKVFVRALNVPVAYHSHHMNPVAQDYFAVLQKVLREERTFTDVHYTSPVTGAPVTDASTIDARHWVQNMLQPVLFVASLSNMCVSLDGEQVVDSIIEIGPHGALAGPIRQTFKLPHLARLGINYSSCLWRGKNAVSTVQDMVATLVAQGYPVNLNAVNFPSQTSTLRALGDLPPYPWNHRTRYWHESRINRTHRNKTSATHDLLGARSLSSTSKHPMWRNIIRPSELPWITDHRVQNDIVYPGAGMLCMAIEAMRQIASADGRSYTGLKLRDIEILQALVVPNSEEGIEVQLTLTDGKEKTLGMKNWRRFAISSVENDGACREHCTGLIDFEGSQTTPIDDDLSNDNGASVVTHSADAIYAHLRSVGIFHGESFRNLHSFSAVGPTNTTASVVIGDTASTMPFRYQQDHLMHPTTLDAIIVAAYTSLPTSGTNKRSGMVPRYIKSMSISSSLDSSPGTVLKAQAKLLKANNQGFHASLSVSLENSKEIGIAIEDLHCVCIGTNLPGDQEVPNRCLKVEWAEDLTLLSKESLLNKLKARPNPEEADIVKDLNRACSHYFNETLAALTASDVESLTWYHKLYYEWMKGQLALQSLSESWQNTEPEEKDTFLAHVARKSTSGAMVCRIGQSLTAILKQEVGPLELMLEDQLLYRYYQQALHIGSSYQQVSKIVDLFAHKYPKAKVLEIGGGTGGCTNHVLQALGGGDTAREARFSHYDFTDVSVNFFDDAKDQFSAWGDLMAYRKLNVEQDPVNQGFESGSYDLIVACQVLHATTNMDKTMSHVRRLLKPGGKLILVETTQDSRDIQLIFGVLPGWWLSEEPERKQSPSLTPALWNTVLTKSGFSGLDLRVRDCEDDDEYVIDVMISTASTDPSPPCSKPVYLICAKPEQLPYGWLDEIFREIRAETHFEPVLDAIESVRSEGDLCIFIDNSSESILAAPDCRDFQCLKRLMSGAQGILWLSYGATISCENPSSALHSGFLRTLRCEYANKRYISLDLEYHDGNPFSFRATSAIVQILQSTFDFDHLADTVDFEYALREDSILVPRIFVDKSKTVAISQLSTPTYETKPFSESDRECRLVAMIPGMLDSLTFIDYPDAYEELPEGFIEISPKAFGLNFRDIMVAMGQLQTNVMGFECSGLVSRIGPNVPANLSLTVGDRVCALLRGHWATHTRVHWTSVAKIPDSMSFENAASIPIVYITAYYALHQLARLKSGETILIHSAAGGVGQAAIQFAQLAGATIYATVGSIEKEELLVQQYGLPREHIFSSRDSSFVRHIRRLTNDNGVDVILNSLAGDLLHETWSCIAPFGRFVEIGKTDFEQNNSLQMAPFVRATSFFAVDLFQLGELMPQITADAFQEVMSLFEAGSLKPVAPVTTYPISQLEKAFRTMQAGKHLGKIVVVPNPSDIVKKQIRGVSLDPKATYAIVGGLGGIGKSIVRRLVDLGAQHLALISRNAKSSKHQAFVAEITHAGVEAVAINVDISDSITLQSALVELQETLPPIKGVIQAAMILQDAIIENMTCEDYTTAVRPKVQGTWNLHHQFQQVDFFIMLSSLVGMSGNPSQANYAAGGSFEDAVARYRSAQGLPAVCLDLGMIGGVGYVARTDGVQERLSRQGYQLVSEQEVLNLVQDAIASPHRSPSESQVLIGVSSELGSSGRDGSPFLADVRFAGLEQSSKTGAGSTTARQNGTPAQNLAVALANAVSFEDAVLAILQAIISKLSGMFGLEEDEVDSKASVSHYGVDSLVAVELRNWLSSASSSDMSIFDIMQSKSLTSLAEVTCRKSKLVSGAAKPSS